MHNVHPILLLIAYYGNPIDCQKQRTNIDNNGLYSSISMLCSSGHCRQETALIAGSILGGGTGLILLVIITLLCCNRCKGQPIQTNLRFVRSTNHRNHRCELYDISLFKSGTWLSRHLQFGKWQGYHRLRLLFDPQLFKVTGSGSDNLGIFTISGTYSLKTGRIGLIKTYQLEMNQRVEDLRYQMLIQLAWNSETCQFEGKCTNRIKIIRGRFHHLSNISSFPSLMNMFQTSNLVCQSVHLTDELKVGVEYDKQRGLLNIFVRNTGHHSQLPTQINILTKSENDNYLLSPSNTQQQDNDNEISDFSYREQDEPKIYIELSTTYVYDIFDENDLGSTMITSPPPPLLLPSSLSSSSSSSSCFDELTTDSDDGYSTHSLDDTEQHQQYSISIPLSKLIIPFVPYQHHYYSEEYVSSIRRLIEQVMWLSPFKKTVKHLMINRLFH